MNIYTHLCFGERKKIEKFLRKGKSIRAIARMLDRGISSISEEIKIGKTNGVYNAKKAEAKAEDSFQRKQILHLYQKKKLIVLCPLSTINRERF
jgi:IS30 family transposase